MQHLPRLERQTQSDILDTLRRGHAYIVFAPDGPTLEMTTGEAFMGDSVSFSVVQEIERYLLAAIRQVP